MGLNEFDSYYLTQSSSKGILPKSNPEDVEENTDNISETQVSEDNIFLPENQDPNFFQSQSKKIEEEIDKLIEKAKADGIITDSELSEISDSINLNIEALDDYLSAITDYSNHSYDEEINELQNQLFTNLQKQKTGNTLTSSKDIKNYLNSQGNTINNQISENIDDISDINKLEINGDQITVETGNNTLTIDTTGQIFSAGNDLNADVELPDNSNTADINTAEETNNCENNEPVEQPVDEEKPSIPETESEKNTTPSVEETTEGSSPEDTTSTETSSSDNNFFASTESNSEGFDFSNVTPSVDDASSSSNINSDSPLAGELQNLQQEKDDTVNDLNSQQQDANQIQSEKEAEVGALDSEIKTGEGELDNANSEVDSAKSTVDSANSEVESAQANEDSAKSDVDATSSDLDNANQKVDESQQASDTAQANNEQKVAQEQQAQAEQNQASSDLNTATGATNAAQSVADTKQNELSTASAESDKAFSVLSQENAKVAQAQREYNAAKTDKSAWEKVKNFVSSLFNKLQAAIQKRDVAEVEAEKKAKEEEKAQAASDEAIEKLDARKEEQATAQDVLDAATVVRDRATGEREVSDQEYAEALLVLANSVTEQSNAESKYNDAFTNFTEMKNYRVNAQGQLEDAQGNLVSATQVATELETYVQGLVANRNTKETSYDNTLNAVAQAISGDETKIENLNKQIDSLKKQIEEEEASILIQEQLYASLQNEKDGVTAEKSAAGICDDIGAIFGGSYKKDEKAIESKQALLEKALLSGSADDIKAAYKAIYGDKEVYILDGKIVDPTTVPADKKSDCKVSSVSSLNDTQLKSYIDNEGKNAVESKQAVEAVSNGCISCNGEIVELDQLTEILLQQANELDGDTENAVKQQGIFSKGISGVNNFLGIGTSSSEMRAAADQYKNSVEKLKSCKDPAQFSALYKEITGQNFDVDSVSSLLAYRELSNKNSGNKTSEKAASTASKGTVDITDYVNGYVNGINNSKNNGATKDSLSFAKNSKAAEKISDYKETQETAKDAVFGVVEGVAVAACVAATPFTGGASLALAAGLGAAMNVGLNYADSIYDGDNDGTLDFDNYSFKEAGKDAALGALNGVVGTVSNLAGGVVTNKVGAKLGEKAIAKFGSKLVGSLAEGAIDGGASSSGEYLIDCAAGDSEFSLNELKNKALQGAAFGALMNGAMTTGGEVISLTAKGINNLIPAKGILDDIPDAIGDIDIDGVTKEIDNIMTGGESNDPIAKIVSGSVQSTKSTDSSNILNKYMADAGNGKVKIATEYVEELTANAKNAYNILNNAGMDSEDIVTVLSQISVDNSKNLPSIIDLSVKNNIIDTDVLTDPSKMSEFFNNANYVECMENDSLVKSLWLKDGENLERYSFNESGKVKQKHTFNKSSSGEIKNDNIIDYSYNKKGKLDSKSTINVDYDENEFVKEVTVETIAKNGKTTTNKFTVDQNTTIKHDGLASTISELNKNNTYLTAIKNLDDKYDIINTVLHGERVDTSLADYKIKVGDKEVQIMTDNNMVTEDFIKKNKILKRNYRIITDAQKNAFEDALIQMEKAGQKLPDKIYYTDLFKGSFKTASGEISTSAGVFCPANPNVISLNPITNNIDYFKEIIYHESGHMADYSLGSNYMNLSAQKGIDIRPIGQGEDIIKYNNIGIDKKSIQTIVSDYGLSNPLEYVAEITGLVTSGKIGLDANGNYVVKYNNLGYYTNAKGLFYENIDSNALKDIMDLYLYLTDGKVVKPYRIQ